MAAQGGYSISLPAYSLGDLFSYIGGELQSLILVDISCNEPPIHQLRREAFFEKGRGAETWLIYGV